MLNFAIFPFSFKTKVEKKVSPELQNYTKMKFEAILNWNLLCFQRTIRWQMTIG